jgi:hypothetical protein
MSKQKAPLHEAQRRFFNLSAYYFDLTQVGAQCAVISAGQHAAALETGELNRKGKDHCDRASRQVRHRHARSDLRASPAFPMGTTFAACLKLQKQGWSSRFLGFLVMATSFSCAARFNKKAPRCTRHSGAFEFV